MASIRSTSEINTFPGRIGSGLASMRHPCRRQDRRGPRAVGLSTIPAARASCLGAAGDQNRRMDNSAIRAIVAVYVRYGNRRAVEDLRTHRGRLLASLTRTLGGPYDLRKLIAQIESEIAVIEAGLTKLKPAA
jgi:hypothetical protein